MPLAAGIIGVAGIAGSVIQGKSASKAARAQQAAAADATASQERIAEQDRAQQQLQYQQTREDFRPFRELGYQGANTLSRAANGDMTGFFTSPDYNFVRSEGQRDLGNSFAARGGAFSGNALKALSELNQNFASGQYGQWWNRQAGLVDAGQGSTAQTAQAGANAANAITGINQNLSSGVARNTLAAGDARASGIMGQGNAIAGGLNNLADLYGTYSLGQQYGYWGRPQTPVNNLYGGPYSGPRY